MYKKIFSLIMLFMAFTTTPTVSFGENDSEKVDKLCQRYAQKAVDCIFDDSVTDYWSTEYKYKKCKGYSTIYNVYTTKLDSKTYIAAHKKFTKLMKNLVESKKKDFYDFEIWEKKYKKYRQQIQQNNQNELLDEAKSECIKASRIMNITFTDDGNSSDARKKANDDYADQLRNPDNWTEVEAHEPEQPVSTDAGARNHEKIEPVKAPISPAKAPKASDIKIQQQTPSANTKTRARTGKDGKPTGTRSANAKTGTDDESIKNEIKNIQKCTREWSSPTAAVGSECRVNKNLVTNEKVATEIEKLKKACTSRKGGKKGISDNVAKFKVRDRGGDGATVPYKCVIDTCKGKFVPDSFAMACVEETTPQQQEAQYCTESGGTYNNGKCDCGNGKKYYPDRQMCDNEEIDETTATMMNNCKADGGKWENNTCDCRDSRIWNKETQTCEIVTVDEATQTLINNCKSDGERDYTKSTCKCHSSTMAWSKSHQSCMEISMLDPEERAAIPNSDLENELKSDIDKLTAAFKSVMTRLTNECIQQGGKVENFECIKSQQQPE